MRRAAHHAAFIASIALFGSSLLLPAFSSQIGQAGSPGIFAMMLGWLGLIASPANLAWLANLLLVASWGFGQARRRLSAMIASLFALGLAALPAITRQVAVDEAGMPRPIVSFGSGYVAWCAAMIVAFVAAWLIRPDQTDR